MEIRILTPAQVRLEKSAAKPESDEDTRVMNPLTNEQFNTQFYSLHAALRKFLIANFKGANVSMEVTDYHKAVIGKVSSEYNQTGDWKAVRKLEKDSDGYVHVFIRLSAVRKQGC